MENAQQYETGPLKKTEAKTERKSGRRSKWSALKVGVIPLPHYIGLASIIFLAAYFSKLPSDMIGGFAVIIILGMLLGDIGLKVPIFEGYRWSGDLVYIRAVRAGVPERV